VADDSGGNSVTADLVAFLRARLEDDEQAARAATAAPWYHNPSKQWLGPEEFERYDRTRGEEFVGYGGPHPFTGCIAATGPADDQQAMADAAHIARHDPARVLAEVDAKRRIMAIHTVPLEAFAGSVIPGDPDDRRCVGCGFGSTEEPMVEDIDDCPVLRALALPYRAHPGYRPEWAPEAD
jgi:hypothetical protein